MKDLPATRRSLLLSVALVTGLAALAYSRVPDDGLVLDDAAAIAQHPGVVHPSLHDLLARAFWGGTQRHPRAAAYRLLTSASFALDWQLARGTPWIFHVTNFALHVLVCNLVLLALWSLDGMRRRAALVAALIFTLHPLHSEAVAGLVGRAALLTPPFLLPPSR